LVGAPWIEAEAFAGAMNRHGLPGVHFRPAAFEPTFQKHGRTPCGGCQIHVIDRRAFRPVATGAALISTFRQFDADRFAWRQPPYEYEPEKLPIDILAGSSLLREQIEASMPVAEMAASWRADERTFAIRRTPYLLY
jgi:uncharacterized protein YbbC (DUF1343 family)